MAHDLATTNLAPTATKPRLLDQVWFPFHMGHFSLGTKGAFIGFMGRPIPAFLICASLDKGAKIHSFCPRFANHWRDVGKGIRTVQELLSHAKAVRTMIYTHGLNLGGWGARMPLDGLDTLPA